jgi:outer membrane protein TolC
VEDAYATLAETVGITPTVRLQVRDLSEQGIPQGLPEAVERVIDQSLASRPDLAARLATLRAREAEVRRAQAEYRPRIGLRGNVGGSVGDYQSGPPFASHTDREPVYNAFLDIEWALFEGFERDNALREAQSQTGVAQADLAALQLQVLREVWKAYADVKTALRKDDFATALLTASQDSYTSTMETYRAGLGTFLDLLAAERDLARARETRIQSRADVLTASAALAFASGAMPGGLTPP